MKIGVIGGTGQGLGVAPRFVQAGEDVVIGSRAVEKAQEAVIISERSSKKRNI